MFGRKYVPLEEGSVIEDAAADVKSAKRVGQYKLSKNAIYKADGTYLATSVVTDITHDKTSVHVSGCCAGGVPVERLIFDTEKGRYPFLFDTTKDVEKVMNILGRELSEY